MRTQTNIIREYANGMADGFMMDLAAGHISSGVQVSENALIEAFIQYVAAASATSTLIPSQAASATVKA
jgi:hypothetical protein